MSDTPDLAQEGVKRFDVVGGDWETLECGLGEYVLFDDYAALSVALTTERARADKAEAERDAAIAAMSEAARMRGEAEGKLLAAETPGVLEGWRRRAEAAEAKLATAGDDALERAARLVETTAYTSSGEARSLQPVSRSFEGMDMHHATIAAAIRAMKGNGNE